MGGFAGLFTGTNPTLNQMTNQSKQVSGWGTGMGEKDIGQASDFFSTLVGGDPQAIMKMLGPQIAQTQQGTQQEKQTAAQFGNRSGGTNAGNQMMDDRTRAMIQDMIARLTGGAAGQEAAIGQGAMNTGLQANQMAVDQSQQQMQNMMNSILGRGINAAADVGINAMTGGMAKIPGISSALGGGTSGGGSLDPFNFGSWGTASTIPTSLSQSSTVIPEIPMQSWPS